MELANGNNLEEFINVQWQPEDDLPSAAPTVDLSHLPPREQAKRMRELARRQRAQEQLGVQSLSSGSRLSARDEYARKYGGIGMGKNGRKVRYLKTEEIWSLFLDICAGLAHLHKHGIIHRDLVCVSGLVTLLLGYFEQAKRTESNISETTEFIAPLFRRQREGRDVRSSQFLFQDCVVSKLSYHTAVPVF